MEPDSFTEDFEVSLIESTEEDTVLSSDMDTALLNRGVLYVRSLQDYETSEDEMEEMK